MVFDESLDVGDKMSWPKSIFLSSLVISTAAVAIYSPQVLLGVAFLVVMGIILLRM
jgi:hypothetical protein